MLMEKSRKLLAVVMTAGALTSYGAANPAASSPVPPAKNTNKASGLFADTIVAEGKGVKITRDDLDNAMTSVIASFTAKGQTLTPEQKNMVEGNVLETLIQMRLLTAKATADDKAKGKELAAKRFEELKTRAVRRKSWFSSLSRWAFL